MDIALAASARGQVLNQRVAAPLAGDAEGGATGARVVAAGHGNELSARSDLNQRAAAVVLETILARLRALVCSGEVAVHGAVQSEVQARRQRERHVGRIVAGPGGTTKQLLANVPEKAAISIENRTV